jgi:hypothetical protein
MLLPESVRGNEPAGITEGYGDFIVAVYYDDRHKSGAGTRGLLFPWSRPAAQLRQYSVTSPFGGSEWISGAQYQKGAIWCATLFEAYRKLGGDSQQPEVRAAARDLAIRLFTDALTKLPVETEVDAPSETVLASAIIGADAELDGWWPANGLHRKVLADTFARRHCTGYRPQDPGNGVDVYISDGRAGGYGSEDGQDHFEQNLWKEDHGAGLGKDLWARRTRYTAAERNGANLVAQHVEPKAGQVSNVYVRVSNRGIQASGPVTVRVFIAGAGPAAVAVADPNLTWPEAWVPGEITPGLTAATVPAGGTVLVGPFPWTPAAAGIQTVLAVVECAADPALTETLLATEHVPAAALVPFDNNLAMRRMLAS